ncbi:fatty acyl-AMP ligase [Streptomyces sp. 8N616]|uniref:fatty acyl-AMP ligase n=1 Tax=Streptomyces sp. 8N616 TaxID=3457414 RepID=UPI003FD444C5
MAALVTAPSVTARLRQHAEQLADQGAAAFVTDPDQEDGVRWLTYAGLDERARSIAVWLRRRIAPGDRVLLLYPAGLEFVAAFFGCLYAGAVAVPSSLPGRYRHERHRVRRIADDAGVSAILTDTATLADVEDWAAEGELRRTPRLATDALGSGGADGWTMAPADHSTLAVLQYTSGSTGDPKGVMITHGNLLFNGQNMAQAFRLDSGTPCGGWAPHFHDMGLMGHIIPPLLLGSATVLMNPVTFLKRPHLWLRMIDRFGIVFSAAPDFAYDLCSRRVTDTQIEQLDLSRWLQAADGAEPVRSHVLERFAKRFAPAGLRGDALVPAYGMAETTLIISASATLPPLVRRVDAAALERNEFRPAPEGVPGREVVSCGTPQGAVVRIVDPRTREVLPEGRVGEIWVRGRAVGQGYWRREETNAAEFRAATADGDSGYLRTGDLGVLYEGDLYVTGRIKDTLILRGRNLYPQDIEHELRAQHPVLGNLVGACFTVPAEGAEDGQEVLVVTQEVRGLKDPDRLRELTADLRLTVAREFGAPVGAVLLLRPGGVQRTTSGKVQRSAMRELFRGGELKPVFAEYEERMLRDPAAVAEDHA